MTTPFIMNFSKLKKEDAVAKLSGRKCRLDVSLSKGNKIKAGEKEGGRKGGREGEVHEIKIMCHYS